MNGYAGNQLRVFLDRKDTLIESPSATILKKYLGGVGYAARILYDELDKGIDPLSPENKLVFATSPLSDNRVPGGGSIMLCFKAPLTGIWGESRCGGDFGPMLRKAGFDFVVIEGQADQPVYLTIQNGRAEFKTASKLVGKTVSEKIRLIRDELNDESYSVMTIGVAGEKMVRYSSALFEQRAAGRCGAGAVMGSKNLLAIAVKGSRKAPIAGPVEFKRTIATALKVVKASEIYAQYKKHGTTGELPGCDASGDWPTKNWQSNSWGKAQELYKKFYHTRYIRNHGCYRGCPIECGRIAKVEEGKFKTPEHEGSEYQSLSAFTAFVLNDDLDAAIHCSYLCNEYGLDTISTGSVIAFAMECFENGIITKDQVNGIDLSWGNSHALPRMVTMIANREGIGDTLAEGVRIAAQRLGKGAEQFAIHGKGLEAPAHDPRSGKALAVTYGTANRGMCHIHPLEGMAFDSAKLDFGLQKFGLTDPNTVDRWDEKGKGRMVKILQDGCIAADILSICKFYVYADLTLDHLAGMFSAATGWKIDGAGLLKIGERVINLQRLFNIREGLSREDDVLPERMKELPSFGSYQKETRCAISDYEGMLEEYYQARGWDLETGVPTPEKLRELEIDN